MADVISISCYSVVGRCYTSSAASLFHVCPLVGAALAPHKCREDRERLDYEHVALNG